MDYRHLGRSGFRVPALSLGTATFGGKGAFFAAWGDTGEEQATRLVDMCLDFGLNMFDSADVYSAGLAEEILGAAIKGKRDRVIISTTLWCKRFEVEPSRRREVALDHAARTTFQILGAVLPLGAQSTEFRRPLRIRCMSS